MTPRIEGAGPRPTVQPAQPSAIDVSTVDVKSADFKKLPSDMQTAVREAKAYQDKHFSGMAPAPRVLVTTSAGNGGSPVTVIVPPGAKDDLRVQTHYHGDRAGSVSGENAAADKIAAQVKAGSKTVYVLPEAKATGTPTNWDNAADFDRTTKDALQAAGLGRARVEHRTISVHSAGGRALDNSTRNGKSITADELIIQDALYTGAYENLVKQLPFAAAGVGKTTIVPSDENSTGAPRGKVLAAAMQKEWNDAMVAQPAKTHAAAAAVFERPAPLPGRDRFERVR